MFFLRWTILIASLQQERGGRIRMVVAVVRSEIVEQEPFHKPVHPALFGNLFFRIELRRADFHVSKFVQRGLTNRRVFGVVQDDKFFEQVGTFQDDAAASRR